MVLRLCSIAFVLLSAVTAPADAAEQYVIDTKGQHAFIEFRIKHLGYSWLYGRFNEFAGAFTLDREAPGSSRASRSRSTPPASTRTMPSATSTCAAAIFCTWMSTPRRAS